MRSYLLIGSALMFGVACSSHTPTGAGGMVNQDNGPDGSTPGADAGVPDASTPDASTPDASTPDASTPDAADAAPSPPLTGSLRLAQGLAVDGLAVFQAVRVAVVEGGAAASRNAPIVAGRDAIVRVYVRPEAGFSPQDVTAHLFVGSGGVGPTRDLSQNVVGASSDAALGSAFDFAVPGSEIAEDTQFWVALTTPDGVAVAEGSANPARFPQDGTAAALGAESDLGGLSLVFVPLRYDTDGSGRLPDTSPAQLDIFRDYLGAIFPYATIDITVRDPVSWTDPLGWDREIEFGDVNSMLIDLRAADGVAPDVYYYGLVTPNESRAGYCAGAFGACTTGQSFVVRDADDSYKRLGSSLGYGGESAARTLAHELGHIHGRSHAPCGGASSPDPSYPYSGGSIGVWGIDPRDSTFQDPSDVTDIMGYCSERWVSDYTYSALFQRNLAIKALPGAEQDPSAPERMRFLHLEDGVARWGRWLSLDRWPTGDLTVLTPRDQSTGKPASVGVRVEQSHADGQMLLVREGDVGNGFELVLDGVRYLLP